MTINDLADAFYEGVLAKTIHEDTPPDKLRDEFLKCLKKPIGIIFLDIDGVLNCILDHEGGKYDHSKRCVGHLNELTDTTGAKIVVSSTWRLGKTVEQMREILVNIGVTGEVIDITPDMRSSKCIYRGNEIHQWIQDNEEIVGKYYRFNRYVILDDDSDMLMWHNNNYVNCDPAVGMTDRTVYKAAGILNNVPCEDIGQEHVKV